MSGFQCLGILYNLRQELIGLPNFIKEVIFAIPNFEDYSSLIKLIQNILHELEIDEEFLCELDKHIKSKKKTFLSLFRDLSASGISKNVSATAETAGHNRKLNSNILANRRRTSMDKSDPSLERDHKEDSKWKNLKIDSYFGKGETKHKNNDKKFTYDSSLFNTKINLSSTFNQFPKSKDKSITLRLDSVKSYVPEPLHLQSDLSYETFAEKIKNSPSRRSLSNKSSLQMEINHNSNTTPFSVCENSKTIMETTIKRPMNIWNSGSAGGGNLNFSSAKSTNFSQVSNSNVSMFSFNPSFLMKSASNVKSYNDGESSQNSSLMNTSSSLRARSGGFGINSLLLKKIQDIPKTKKSQQSRNLSNKKKKIKEKSMILENFKEKCSKGHSAKKNENSDLNKEDKQKNNLKNLVNKKFYDNLKFIEKSPDQAQDFLNHKVQRNRSRSMSGTDDEVLVYQTPVKVNTVVKKTTGGVPPSPKTTTRKNLYDLFNQIGK
jgi:hypothetical protein